MNSFVFTGYLGKDPEINSTPSGSVLAKVPMGINEYYNKETHTTWVDLVVWGKSAENFADLCGKGDKVLASGKVRKETWEDREGNKRSTYSFVVLTWELLSTKDNSRRSSDNQDDEVEDYGTAEYAF